MLATDLLKLLFFFLALFTIIFLLFFFVLLVFKDTALGALATVIRLAGLCSLALTFVFGLFVFQLVIVGRSALISVRCCLIVVHLFLLF